MILDEKDYKLKGFKTGIRKKKLRTDKTRIIALCREEMSGDIQLKTRPDLSSDKFPSIWIEVTNNLEKNVLVCG